MARKRPIWIGTSLWRNHDLPVIRDYKLASGKIMIEVSPGYERRYREHLMETAAQPRWQDDPTYDLKRRKR